MEMFMFAIGTCIGLFAGIAIMACIFVNKEDK